jgi:phage terminase large subunit
MPQALTSSPFSGMTALELDIHRALALEELQQRGDLPRQGSEQNYSTDPAAFARDRLRAHPWSRQREVFHHLAEPCARVSVRSCNGVGKTWLAGAAALWFLNSFSPCRVVTTAPKLQQLRNSLWAEIRLAHARSGLPGECETLALRLSDERFAVGQTATDATSFQGLHAPHILVIAEEAAGIEEPIWEGIDALLTSEDARLLIIGNPTSSSGRFYDSHHSLRSLYRTVHISALDSPNFTSEAVPDNLRRSLITRTWAERQAEEWGQDSPLYRARVLGEFPDQAEGSLIALSWIEAARDSGEASSGPVEMGLDVARQGGCENVAYIRQGATVLACDAWRSDDLMQTAGRAASLIREWGVTTCRVDSTGMGAGVYDRLKEQGLPAVDVWVGATPRDTERFVMLRDEIGWGLRERLRTGDVHGLTDTRTQAQLSALQYGFDSRGRIKIESKDEMQRRGLPSPDRADALVLAYAATKRPQLAIL